MDDNTFNVYQGLGMVDGNNIKGSDRNQLLLRQRTKQLLKAYRAMPSLKTTAGQRSRGSLVLAIPFCVIKQYPRPTLGTVAAMGPYTAVEFLVKHMPTPQHLLVATLDAAIQHIVMSVATQILNGQDLPAILLVGVVKAFLAYGIVVRLHPNHRAEGNELMTHDGAIDLHEGRVEEPNEPADGAAASVQTLLARLTGGEGGQNDTGLTIHGNHSQAGRAGSRWESRSDTVNATLRITSGSGGAAAAAAAAVELGYSILTSRQWCGYFFKGRQSSCLVPPRPRLFIASYSPDREQGGCAILFLACFFPPSGPLPLPSHALPSRSLSLGSLSFLPTASG